MKILTANDALKLLDRLNITYLAEGLYRIGNGSEVLTTSLELDKLFQMLEETYATDEFLNELSALNESIVWLVDFEKDPLTGKWQSLFKDENLNEIWINL